MKFSTKDEDKILNSCLRSKSFLKQASRVCESHHFTGKERIWIWEQISQNFRKHGECLGRNVLEKKLRRAFKDSSKRTKYADRLNTVYERKAKHPLTLLESLADFVREATALGAVETAARSLEANDLEGAFSAMKAATSKTFDSKNYEHVRWFEEWDKRQAERKFRKSNPHLYRGIRTGIPRLDEALGGGIRPGEFGIVMAPTGSGKSLIATNIAQSVVDQGKGVLYVALEMPASQIANRADSRWSRKKYDAFKNYEFGTVELKRLAKRQKKYAEKYANKFHIVSMPVRTATISSVRGILDDLKNDFDFVPDLIIVDSVDHLVSQNRGKSDAFRMHQADVYWDAKALCTELSIPLITTCHVNKTSANKIAKAEDAAESYDKARIADWIVSINDPSRQRDRNKSVAEDELEEAFVEDTEFVPTHKFKPMILYVAKNRDGESDIEIKIEIDYARMFARQRREEREDDFGPPPVYEAA